MLSGLVNWGLEDQASRFLTHMAGKLAHRPDILVLSMGTSGFLKAWWTIPREPGRSCKAFSNSFRSQSVSLTLNSINGSSRKYSHIQGGKDLDLIREWPVLERALSVVLSENVLCRWEVPDALCSLCPSPASFQFHGSSMGPSEYAIALTKPFFICQLPNGNLVSELLFYI